MKAIMKNSVPAAFSLLVSAIYNIVDKIFVGNYSETGALADLSICFPLTYMMMTFGLMCSADGLAFILALVLCIRVGRQLTGKSIQ